jgi:RNA polymerase sigma-70 factor (ECF subfamily)
MLVYLDDKRLVKQLLAGDQRAFDRFFEENFARLYRFAMVRLSDDPEGAREVAQTTLIRAVRKLHQYRAESALFTWLCAICRNETSDWLHRQIRYREHIILSEDYPEIQAAVDSFQIPVEDDPEAQCQRTEAMRLIQVALDRLPAKYGNVLEWKYVEGYSLKEISAKLEIGTEAAQSLLARAKRAFAEVYSSLNDTVGNAENGLLKS